MAGDDERARPCPHSGLEHLEGVQVQVVRGLVDDKHLRPSSSGKGQLNAALVAVGELADGTVPQARVQGSPAAVPDPLGPHVLIHPRVAEFRQVLRYPEHRTGYREAADGVLRGC